MIARRTAERPIGPYPANPAAGFHEYDPRAEDVARRVAELVTARLPSVRVEHVGSTAVPGCAGKGVVDMMITYAPGQLERGKQVLEELGFQRQKHGHIMPEDRPMRVGTLRHDGTLFRLHMHVIAANSPEAVTLRAFRDRLKADPALLADYVAQKRAIVADGATVPVEYTRRKSQFIQAVQAGR